MAAARCLAGGSSQIAIIVGGTFGPFMFGLFLVFLVATLLDAEFAYYDSWIARTTCEAVSVTPALRRLAPYRTYYFIMVTAAILAGFYLVTLAQPFILWLINSYFSLLFRSVGAICIWYLCKSLPDGFKNTWYLNALLWITAIAGFFMLGLWTYAYFTGQ